MKTSKLYTGDSSVIDRYFDPQYDCIEENWAVFDKNNHQHKTILSLLRQAQWVVAHPRHGEVADMRRLSDFLKSKRSPIRKPLQEMTREETSVIIVALKGIARSQFK